MSVLTDFASDFIGAMFDTEYGQGQSATYTPKGGSPSSITAVIAYGENLSDQNWRTAIAALATVYVKASDVAAPAVYDEIAVGGDTWTVENIIRGDGFVWALSVKRDLRPTFKR